MHKQPECWCCGTRLIWGGDHDQEDADGREYIETNLSCPSCDAFYLMYQPVERDSQDVEGT